MKKQTTKHLKYALLAFGILAMANQLTVCAASDVDELEKEPTKSSMARQVSLLVAEGIPEQTTRIQVGVYYPNRYFAHGQMRCAVHRGCMGFCVIQPIYQTITASVNSQTHNIT